MTALQDHWFGLRPPEAAQTAIGWRTIYEAKYKRATDSNCPTCKAWYGSSCRTKRGKLRSPHKAREDLSGFQVNIDFVPGRGNSIGEEADKERLREWLNSKALPWLEEECRRGYVKTMDNRLLHWRDGEFVIEANPRRSGGYLYIVAYRIST